MNIYKGISVLVFTWGNKCKVRISIIILKNSNFLKNVTFVLI